MTATLRIAAISCNVFGYRSAGNEQNRIVGATLRPIITAKTIDVIALLTLGADGNQLVELTFDNDARDASEIDCEHKTTSCSVVDRPRINAKLIFKHITISVYHLFNWIGVNVSWCIAATTPWFNNLNPSFSWWLWFCYMYRDFIRTVWHGHYYWFRNTKRESFKNVPICHFPTTNRCSS